MPVALQSDNGFIYEPCGGIIGSNGKYSFLLVLLIPALLGYCIQPVYLGCATWKMSEDSIYVWYFMVYMVTTYNQFHFLKYFFL